MAGGFFRENSNVNEVELQPFVLKDLPKVSSNVAKPSASLSLDATTSSADESSDDQEFEHVSVLPTESASDVMKQSNNFGSPQIHGEDILKQNNADESADLSDAVIRKHIAHEKNRNSNDAVPKEISSDPVQSNELKVDINNDKIHSIENIRTLGGDISENMPIDNEYSIEEGGDRRLSLSHSPDDILHTTCISSTSSSISKLPETGEICQQELSPERVDLDTELDDLEDEINQKKRLIEKLLSNRPTSKTIKSPSDETENVGNSLEEKSLCDEGQNSTSMQVCAASDISLEHENNSRNSSDSKNAGSNPSTAMKTGDSVANSFAQDMCDTETSQPTEIDAPVPNEFEGITYVSITIY